MAMNAEICLREVDITFPVDAAREETPWFSLLDTLSAREKRLLINVPTMAARQTASLNFCEPYTRRNDDLSILALNRPKRDSRWRERSRCFTGRLCFFNVPSLLS